MSHDETYGGLKKRGDREGVLTIDGTLTSLGNLYVQSILEDANGQLWFGTSGGVYLFNGRTFTNFTKEEALRPA